MEKLNHFRQAEASPPEQVRTGKRNGRIYLIILMGLALLLSLLFSYGLIRNIGFLQEKALGFMPEPANQWIAYKTDPSGLGKYNARLQKNLSIIQKKLDKFTPQGPYLVVNTSENHFWLYSNSKLIREGMCSTGSYTVLTVGGKQKYVFETPRGMFRIQGKITSPVWKKPDWAFIEEGLPVPAPDAPERYENGVLGDYAMSIGHGYLIHGTLYKRFLGMPVTHGCVRLGDDDLEAIYKTLQIGSKVFIY